MAGPKSDDREMFVPTTRKMRLPGDDIREALARIEAKLDALLEAMQDDEGDDEPVVSTTLDGHRTVIQTRPEGSSLG